jgi:hypothetical protein
MGPHPNPPDEHHGQRHHDPEHGETRFPPEESPQSTAEGADPHEPLNTPVDDVEPPVHNKQRVPDRSQEHGNMGAPRKSRGKDPRH